MVDVALLPRLRNPQVLSYHANLLLGFLQYVGSKNLLFSSLTPKQRGSAPTTIHHLKRCNLQTLLITIVVGELGIRQTYPNFFHIAEHKLSAYL
jgi:hypothetical protein